MLVNRKRMRIFLTFLILFGLYQMYGLLTLSDPTVPGEVIVGANILIATIILISGYVLYKTR